MSILVYSFSYAQEEGFLKTSKGSFLVEINTGFGEASTANTSLIIRSGGDGGGGPEWAAGGEVGCFIADNLALKLGLGYSDIGGDDNVSGEVHWKFGTKYYVIGKFPIQVDLNGLNRTFGDDPDNDPTTPPVETPNATPLWLGFQAGYAWMIANNVNIEPGLRFAKGLNTDADDKGSVFGVNIGFNIIF